MEFFNVEVNENLDATLWDMITSIFSSKKTYYQGQQHVMTGKSYKIVAGSFLGAQKICRSGRGSVTYTR